MSSNGRGASAAEDSIVPMTLVSLEAPTQQEAEALETLYQTAAQTAWVLRLGDCQDVPQATDLETAMRHGQAGRWTRGLLVQAAVMEALGLGDSANLLPPEQLSRGLIQAFANFVQSRCIHPLKAQPKHTPQLYLQIWSCIQDMGEAGFLEGSVDQLEFADPMHPGLVNAVPRKRRSGAAHCQVDGRKVARSIVEPAQYDGQGGAAVLRDQRPNDQHGCVAELGGPAGADQQNPAAVMTLQQQQQQQEQMAQHAQNGYMPGYDAVVDVAPSQFFKEGEGLQTLADVSQAYYGDAQHDSLGHSGRSSSHTNSAAHLHGAASMAPAHVLDTHSNGARGSDGPAPGRAPSMHAGGMHRPSTQTTDTPTPEELAGYDTLEKLQSVFHKPINDAAAALGMGVTVLKKLCRDRNIQRWPYRKLSSVDKLIESVQAVLADDENDEATKEAYQSLINLRNNIFEDPAQDLNDWAKKLRQANFKQQYKMRQSGPNSGYCDSGS